MRRDLGFLLVLSLLTLLLFQHFFFLGAFDGVNVEARDSYGYVSVPFHFQNQKYYCGPAALEMVFDYYGEDVSQLEIADVARTHPSVTYTEELRRAAHFSNSSTSVGDEMPTNITGYSTRTFGYAAFEQSGLTVDDLKSLIDKQEPLIVLMWQTPSKDFGHYRVVIGYNQTHIITHDPWNKDLWGGVYGGPNTSINYSTFLDLWSYENYWGLWIHPWTISVQVSSTVNKDENFTIEVNVTYPCPAPFNTNAHSASQCKATILLQKGLALTSGQETQFLGHINTETPIQTSWLVHADQTISLNITVLATGTINDSVVQHETFPSYEYEDEIGGATSVSLLIIPEFPMLPVLSLSMIIVFVAVLLLKKTLNLSINNLSAHKEEMNHSCAFALLDHIPNTWCI